MHPSYGRSSRWIPPYCNISITTMYIACHIDVCTGTCLCFRRNRQSIFATPWFAHWIAAAAIQA